MTVLTVRFISNINSEVSDDALNCQHQHEPSGCIRASTKVVIWVQSRVRLDMYLDCALQAINTVHMSIISPSTLMKTKR
jgi:hypothetical protein